MGIVKDTRKGLATSQYMIMIIFLILTILAFRFYIQGGYNGQMVRAGEGFAFGRQYDTTDTITCAFFSNATTAFWYSQSTYDALYDQWNCKVLGPTCSEAVRANDVTKFGCMND